jgi:type III pantothenate kinase
MDLMVDIGNTQTVLGIFENSILKNHWRVTSQFSRTEDEIWVVVDSLFNLDHCLIWMN